MKIFLLFLSILSCVCFVSCKKDTNAVSAHGPGLPGGASAALPAPGPCAGVNTSAYLQAYQKLLSSSLTEPATKKLRKATKWNFNFVCTKYDQNPVHFDLVTYDWQNKEAVAQSPRADVCNSNRRASGFLCRHHHQPRLRPKRFY